MVVFLSYFIKILIELYFFIQTTGAATTIVNGVPVIDVSALEQAADSSNESTATGETQAEGHGDTDPIGQASPHFITVTGGYCSS